MSEQRANGRKGKNREKHILPSVTVNSSCRHREETLASPTFTETEISIKLSVSGQAFTLLKQTEKSR